jgi:hypothetical protein
LSGLSEYALAPVLTAYSSLDNPVVKSGRDPGVTCTDICRGLECEYNASVQHHITLGQNCRPSCSRYARTSATALQQKRVHPRVAAVATN